jgi:hypothetical protein
MMRKILSIFFSLFLFATMVFGAGDSVQVNLGVDGCNNNNICEASLGETTLSCPNDCTGGPPGGGGPTPTTNYFYNVVVTPAETSATINWSSYLPTLATVKWGRTTDYLDGVISGTTYISSHTANLATLIDGTRYYFLIEGKSASGVKATPYAGFFDTIKLPDLTPPLVPLHLVATPYPTNITLTWQNPPDVDFDYVRLVRNFVGGNTNPLTGRLVYEGSGQYAVDADVVPFQLYFYTLFARDINGNFSQPAEASARITPPPIDPCELNPFSCNPPPPGDCATNPSLCTPPPPIGPVRPPLQPVLPPQVIKIITPTQPGPVFTAVVNKAPIVGVITGAGLSLITFLFANPFSIADIGLILLRLWTLLLIALGLKKRTPPWGVVYDSVTKQPLDPAYVVLYDMNGNELATSITDMDGRFGFLVEPGKYRIVANKTNYEFPSKRLAGKTEDEVYGDLYMGTEIEVTESGAVIAKNIPMDPLAFDWNEFAKNQQRRLKFFRQRDVWLGRLSNVLFRIGFVFSAYAVLVSPTGYNIAIFTLSVVLYILRALGLRAHPKGSVSDQHTDEPLPFSIVRVHSIATGQEVFHKVADRTGQYFALMSNGEYRVSVDKKNPDESYTTLPLPEPIVVKEGYLKKHFKI